MTPVLQLKASPAESGSVRVTIVPFAVPNLHRTPQLKYHWSGFTVCLPRKTYTETPSTRLKTETLQLANPSTPRCHCGRYDLTHVPSQMPPVHVARKVCPGHQVCCQACSTHRNQTMKGTIGSRRGVSLRPFGRAWCSANQGLL